MTRLHEALELCLNDLERGSNLDVILSRYPDQADELRPILKTAMQARNMSVLPPTDEVVKRNRAKVLQHVALIREEKRAPAIWVSWPNTVRRSFIALMVLVVFLVSGTNIVRASAAALPGDGLYSVKRGWEDVRLIFTFNPEKRDALTLEYASERLDEIHEILALGRSARVEFSGYVSDQNGDEWLVSGIGVFISSETLLPKLPVQIGAAVRVKGLIRNRDGIVAEQIELLPPDSNLPRVDKDSSLEQPAEASSGVESGTIPTVVPRIITSTPIFDVQVETIEGVVRALESNFVVVDEVLMDIQFAEVDGIPRIGVIAKAEGYYDADGIFVVARIKFEDNGSSNGSGSSNNNNENGNNNSNANDNDDDDDDDNKNSNDNESDDD
ncbi:MAG: DUF5667 domain-containing protein [Anaerolineales bacterium]|nr:DUF5667 domain-containing protein [Anaerolineales bacterium]